MSTMSYHIPTQEDAALAVASSRSLSGSIGKSKSTSIRLDNSNEVLEVPATALRILVDILDTMAKGEAVSIIPVHKELTTQEAATILNVSRPYLVKLIESGEMPFHKVGTRRRILFKDLMDYKQKRDKESMALANELTAEAQELGMGY